MIVIIYSLVSQYKIVSHATNNINCMFCFFGSVLTKQNKHIFNYIIIRFTLSVRPKGKRLY